MRAGVEVFMQVGRACDGVETRCCKPRSMNHDVRIGVDYMKSIAARVVCVCAAVVCLSEQAPAQTGASVKITIAEKDIRALLPPDGELISQGEVSKSYVGVSLGRRVRAKGKHIYVSDEKVGPQGMAFRAGYIEFNLGAHVEKEEKVLLTPTLAVDAAVTAKVWIRDDRGLVVHWLWHEMSGDNLGGHLAMAFAHGQITESIDREARKVVDAIWKRLLKEIPEKGAVHVLIQPGTLTIASGPRPRSAPPIPGRREFLCHESDKCGEPRLAVLGAAGPVEVGKGQTSEVHVRLNPDGWFFWLCDQSVERTRPVDRHTNVVVSHRESNGRGIDWYCYNELPPGL
jgi:hypothetical protein